MKFPILFAILLGSCAAFSTNRPSKASPPLVNRRDLMKAAPVALSIIFPMNSWAGIDPNALKSLKVEGDQSGANQRLRQLAADSDPAPKEVTDVVFEQSPSGVSYGDYREGKGDTVVKEGSKVAVEMTIRIKSFATANEPGGVKYFSTKQDTDFNELAWTIGSGELLPGLEEGMQGMKKGGIRRIEIPSTQVFSARNNNQLPQPSEKSKDGQRRYNSMFKTDATLLFEVLVTRIKSGVHF